jgi:uncharacterized protein YbbC (DUF1343 family)
MTARVNDLVNLSAAISSSSRAHRAPRRARSGAWPKALAHALLLLLVFTAVSSAASPPGTARPGERVILGNEIFCGSFPAELNDRRLGLVINQTSVLPGGPSLLEKLVADGRRVTAIFAPEHGLSGTIEGGLSAGGGSWRGIPVFSLYGKQNRPSAEQLRRVDALVYDIQDIGTRFYTYITTLKFVIESAAAAGLPVYVLDRPDPLGGRIVEGPILEKRFESFIAALPVPTRYGLTAGELARMMKGEGWVASTADIRVIPVANWTRGQTWSSTRLPWIPPSPNIPTAEAALAFPGLGLLGGIKINQGLGTDLQFQQFGAPWLDPEELVRAWTSLAAFPVRLRPVAYRPCAVPGKSMTPPYKDWLCRGLRLDVTDPERFFSLRFALELFAVLKRLYPGKISVASPTLNQMFGDETLALFIDGRLTLAELLTQMDKSERRFLEARKKYLLYEDR